MDLSQFCAAPSARLSYLMDKTNTEVPFRSYVDNLTVRRQRPAPRRSYMMTPETLIVIFVIAGSGGALYVAWRADKNAFKPTGPDEELVKRFVETAPLHLFTRPHRDL
tara:strand:+ start:200 stop:523 length:324 start_codon:yes stop_codon:yes gene_type:complete